MITYEKLIDNKIEEMKRKLIRRGSSTPTTTVPSAVRNHNEAKRN
jgi:hypothetical protein